MIIRSKAPLRISFGGGGTDVSPYPEERGGAVLNATIDKYAYCTLVTRSDDSIKVRSLDYDIAEVAYHIEREEAGIKGGKQDQYAASFGGFNFIEFLGKTTIVNPLRVKREVLNELEYRLMLCYTGKTRLSAGIVEDQISGYIQKKESVVHALDETKQLAISIKMLFSWDN